MIVAKRWRKSGKSRKCSCMEDEKEGKTLVFLVARERETRAVLSTVVPRKTMGEWICRRLMAWLREIGLESVDIIVKSDNEPALTSLIASWSTMRAMMSGSRMIVENSPVGSSKSNGIVERAIQSVQGMIRTIRSDIVAPTQSLSSSCSTTRMSVREGGDGCKEATKKRKAEEEHPEDPERDDGKWMRTDGNKRKVGEEREESRLRKTVRYLKELDKMENQKESGKHRRSWRWRMLR